MSTTLLISTFPPFPSLALTLSSDTCLADVPAYLPDFIPSFSEGDLVFTRPSGSLHLDSTPLSALWDDGQPHPHGREDDEEDRVSHRLVSLRLGPRVRGGKGGFGSQLRAAGGRMSSQKTSNNDSCRDLNGRRLSTLKEAKTLAAYLESEPERIKAQQEAQRAKLERLEKRLGINGKGKDKVSTDGDEVPAGQKRRFDDTEYLEQSRDIVDNVKSAVAAGLLKKKKKAKTLPSPDSQEAASSSSASSSKANDASKEASNVDNESVLDLPAEKTTEVSRTLDSPIAAPPSASLTAIGA